MATTRHQQLLRKYAALIVRVGLNLQKGQCLIINNSSTRGVPLHAAPLVREVARAAYAAGATFVDVIWNDEDLLHTRLKMAAQDTLREYPTWQTRGLMDTIDAGGAMLTIRSNNPGLLGKIDPKAAGLWNKVHIENFDPVLTAVTTNKLNWCVVAAAGPAWARKVFPRLGAAAAEARLWRAIFQITRVDRANPTAAWESHIARLVKLATYLNGRQYTGLKYTGPGTDLTVGLPRGHRWLAAREQSQAGIAFTANLPTEEVFTLPHRERTEGTVRATMPLAYAGSLIEDLRLTFESGRVVRATAKRGEAALRGLIETDEGASRLGEVALVSQSSPVAKLKTLFYDTLLDENASSHLAIGRAYHTCIDGGSRLSPEEFGQRGGNSSLVHVDFMIGSNKMDIDGLREDGHHEPVMRMGEWAFDL